VLLSAVHEHELREALALKRVHSAYDRAKMHLEKMSTEYTELGMKLQAAETRAASLRTELESKIRDIRGDLQRRGDSELTSNSRGNHAFTMSLASSPRREWGGDKRLKHEVHDLKAEVRRLDANSARQEDELRQALWHAPSLTSEASSFKQFPLHAMQQQLAFGGGSGTRNVGDIVLRAALISAATNGAGFDSHEPLAEGSAQSQKEARVQQLNLELEDENRRICELCAKSAMLRANRAHTCGICVQSPGEVEGDTDLDITGYSNEKKRRTQSRFIAGEAIAEIKNLFVPS
jgi:predicted RNase H-like nuclease (RuvC/YqgF family)